MELPPSDQAGGRRASDRLSVARSNGLCGDTHGASKAHNKHEMAITAATMAVGEDLKLCQTTVGPHRDDMLFSVDGVDIRKYGSQGQQRTSALSLKLSEISLVKKNINSTPVLLLDDVLSELDGNRQNYLLNSLSDTQTIITCTGLDEFVKNRFQVDKVFHVVKGQVEVIDE